MYQLPLPDGGFAAAVLHQVLHFADDPFAALAEARRVLAPGGRLVVVDLARHELERLRERKRHRRLGFADDEIAGWFEELDLEAAEPVRLKGPELTVVIWSARRQRRGERVSNDLTRRDAA
jgi:SAM-dependent methyltransferase